MGTIKRLNEARKAQKDAENAMPGAYQSQYKDRINETLDAMGGAGADSAVDTLLDKAYQQYRQQAGQNAAAAARNAVDVTSGLSGGYSSDWAGNVAQQGYNEAMAAVDDAMPSLRARALSQYQNQQNDLSDRLRALMNQESLAQNQYQGSVADAQNWRDYRQSRTDMAKQENKSFWNNVWNSVKNVGAAALNAYDTYKGYTSQTQAATAQAINQAVKLKADGADDAAVALLNAYGLDPKILDTYDGMTPERVAELYNTAINMTLNGAKGAGTELLTGAGLDASVLDGYTGPMVTWQDQLSGILKASGLAQSGDDTGKNTYLNLLNLPTDSVSDYSTFYNQAWNEYVNKQRLAKSLSGSSGRSGSGSSGKSGTSGGSNHGYTNAQLLKMSKTYSSMKDSDPQKEYYQQVLTDAGYLEPETASAAGGMTAPLAGVEPYTPASSKLHLSTVTQKSGNTAQSGSTKSSGMPYANALNYAKGWKTQGLGANEIASRLMNMGASDDVIDRAMQNAGF